MAQKKGEAKSFKEFFEGTKLKQVMTTPVVTIQEDDPFSLAQIKFIDHHISHLVVLDDRKKFVGVISQKYLYKAQSPRKIISEEMDYDPELIVDGDSFYEKTTLDRYILRNIMNKNAYTLKPDNTLAQAVTYMARKNIGCIPIIDDQRNVRGIVTNQEVVDFVSKFL